LYIFPIQSTLRASIKSDQYLVFIMYLVS